MQLLHSVNLPACFHLVKAFMDHWADLSVFSVSRVILGRISVLLRNELAVCECTTV